MFSVLLPSTAEESSNDSLSIGGQQVQQTNANLHFLHFTVSQPVAFYVLAFVFSVVLKSLRCPFCTLIKLASYYLQILT